MITTLQRLLTKTKGETLMENKKNFYEGPKFEVIRFDTEDIITTSGGNWKDPAELEEIED